MTPIGTVRFCPYHGGYVKLAKCPIVATSVRFNEEDKVRRRRQPAARARPLDDIDEDLGGDDLDDDVEPLDEPAVVRPGAVVTRNVLGDLGPRIGEPLTSRVDGVERVVLAVAPGLPVPAARPRGRRFAHRPQGPPPTGTLPTLMDLAGGRDGRRARPARACPECWHPFPVTIDQRNAYPVALIGHAEASKTSTVLALLDDVAQHGAAELGVRSFAATEQTMRNLARNDSQVFANFRKGIGPKGTQPEHHAPLEFLTYLPNTDRQVALLVQDAAGEDLMDEETRAFRTFLWSDVVIFLYNPEDSRAAGGDRLDQAVLLDSVRNDIESYGGYDASGREFPEPKLIVAVSKADLLDGAPDLQDGPAPEEEVMTAVVGLGDGALVSAAERWKKVHWRFIAPMPDHGGGPQGVTDLFSLLLTLLEP
ncbi:MAG: hypothetical protein QOJ63_1874 [Solirubrobacteraceae bacterium]|jgi:hypothetical protein|nr:hypothetical protein [Solirubrobacteraceae bacterium]